MKQGNTGRIVVAVVVAAAMAVLALVVQFNRPSPQAGGSTPVASTETSPSETSSSETSSSAASPSAANTPDVDLEAFLRDELPRRDANDPLAKGSVDAPVVLTEWADYRCPFCSIWAEETLPQLQRYIDDGVLRVEFRDLAIFGDESVKAATAARAAGRQGKYFEFQHALFVALPDQGHPDVPDEVVHKIVADLGLDAERFAADWADPALAEAVAADSAEAQSLGITSTPAFVIGTRYLAGAQPVETFRAVIEEQAAAAAR